MRSEGPFTVIYSLELKKLVNHNQYDPYLAALSIIHESPCIDMCLCENISFANCNKLHPLQ